MMQGLSFILNHAYVCHSTAVDQVDGELCSTEASARSLRVSTVSVCALIQSIPWGNVGAEWSGHCLVTGMPSLMEQWVRALCLVSDTTTVSSDVQYRTLSCCPGSATIWGDVDHSRCQLFIIVSPKYCMTPSTRTASWNWLAWCQYTVIGWDKKFELQLLSQCGSTCQLFIIVSPKYCLIPSTQTASSA